MGAPSPIPPPPARGAADDIRIEECPPADAGAWDRFLETEPSGSFYHLYAWREINANTLGHASTYLAARDNGRIRGVLPLTLVSSKLFGRILCSMPFVNYGGPCAADPLANDALVAAARRQARERRVKYLELRCRAALETDMPVSTRKISMSIALERDPEALFARFTSKHRTNIRRSFKNGLEVRGGGKDLLPVFYRIMEQSWHQLGTPFYSRRYFESILDAFGDRVRIFVCSRGEEPVAVAFNGYFNGTVEGLWAGGTPAARGLQANYALYWDMMKDACERGFARYHLGRSTADSGAEDFKKKWNATSEQLYWYFDRPDGGPMPEFNVANPKFQLAIAAWKRMPLALTRLVGPPLARSIP